MEDRLTWLIKEQRGLEWIGPFLQDHPQGELFLVGGAIRDTFLKRVTKDFDFVIRGLTQQQIADWFSVRGTLDFVGERFGVYKFLPTGFLGEAIDLALPRTEQSLPGSQGGYKEFSIEARMDLPMEMDLARRDFTINAIAFDLRTHKLIDPFHGVRDIEAQLIRAVGVPKERLQEDLSRLLRAIRFSCAFGFHLEEETWKAIGQLAQAINDKNADNQWVVPRETVGREFLKSFLTDPACTLVKYQTCGLLAALFPGFDADRAQILLGDASGLPPRLLLSLFLLTAPDATEARTTLETFHFSQFPKAHRYHVDMEEILWLLRSVHALDVIENPRTIPGSIFERLFLGPKGQDLLDLMTLSGSVDKEKIATVRSRIAVIRETFGDDIPELVSGDDLLTLKLKPGPQFREIITRVRDAQFSGRVSTKEEALDYVRTLL